MQETNRKNLSQEVYEQMLRNITNKVWCPGDRLPPEKDLMQQFAVSRITIREAIRQMVSLGLLKTIQGAKAAFDAGFQFRELQIGTTEGGAGKKAIGVCYLSREDAEALRDLSSAGVHIYFQSNCDSKAQDWSSLQAKHFPDL